MIPGRSAHPAAGARRGWNPLTLAGLAALWIAAAANWPLWRALLALPESGTVRGMLFIVGFGLMIAALLTPLLALFAWRATIKPAIGVLLLMAAPGAYFMGAYHVVIDTTMMTNVVETDPAEVRDLLSASLLCSLAALAGLPLIALWRVRVSSQPAWAQAGRNLLGAVAALLLLAALVFALFADLSATMRNHRTMRYLINPFNSLYAVADLAARSAQGTGPPSPIGEDARIAPRPAGARPPLLVLVVGETARADHFSLNGYARPTNPELASLDVVSFSRVTSCGTNTAASLPCMFSRQGREEFIDREHDEENLLDLVQRAGMAVLWLDNQAGCKGVCDRVPHGDARDAPPNAAAPSPSLCTGPDCLDEALLVGLDQRLAALPAAARARGLLLVLHQMGSHGPAYYRRSPADRKPFLPECTTNVLQQCKQAELVNAYDNSIAYTDHMLAQTQRWLRRQDDRYDTALLYVSDHGESLGENHLYLHGLPYGVAPAAQTHVPLLLWMSERTVASTRLQPHCLQTRGDDPLSHDNLFHSVLGLLGIETALYRRGLDILAPCRAA